LKVFNVLSCNIFVLNARAPAERKSDDSKDSFYDKLEHAFQHFPKYRMKILFGNFNANLGREGIFKSTVGNESLCQDSNDFGVRIVNFLTHKKIWLLRARCFHTETFTITPGTLQMGRLTRLIIY
jgi:hypothetical protein